MTVERSILHIDMDAFFASVEQRDRPELRGKPVLVGHDGLRGVVAAASYEARRFGCHSAQPMAVAKRRCPAAIVVPVNGRLYGEVSRQMFAILDSFSPLIEPLSVDEAFLDLTGTDRTLGNGENVVYKIKARFRSELNLTASAGLAPNKFLAKLASDMNKPDGVMVINADNLDSVMLPLPVSRIWGIGKVTAERLASVGIHTVADLRALPMESLGQYFGADAQRYWRLARGMDDRPVVSDRKAKSIGHEQTFSTDIGDAGEVKHIMLGQVEQVARRLRRHQFLAKGVTIKIRFGDFQTITRSTSLEEATDVTSELWHAARKLFDDWPFQPVRLVGVAAERLTRGEAQGGLFADPEHARQKDIDRVADQIAARFGKSAIRRGGAK